MDDPAESDVTQSNDDILKCAKAGEWHKINTPNDPILKEAVRLKMRGIVEAIITKDFDLALRRTVFNDNKSDVNERLHLANLLLPKVKYFHTSSKSKDVEGITVLHSAAANGWLEFVKLLIEKYQMYPDIVDEKTRTPLYYACTNNNVDIALYLIQKGACLTSIIYDSNGKQIGSTKPWDLFTNYKAKEILSDEYETSGAKKIRLRKFSLPELPAELQWVAGSSGGNWPYRCIKYPANVDSTLKKLMLNINIPFYTATDLINFESQYNCELPLPISELLNHQNDNYCAIMVKLEHFKALSNLIQIAAKISYLENNLGLIFEDIIADPINSIFSFNNASSAFSQNQLAAIQYCNPLLTINGNKITVAENDLETVRCKLATFNLDPIQKEKISILENNFGCEFVIRPKNQHEYDIVSKTTELTEYQLSLTHAGKLFCKVDNGEIRIHQLHLDSFLAAIQKEAELQSNAENDSRPQCANQ